MADAVTKTAQQKSKPVAKKEPSIIEKGITYLKESYAEARRATWPSWLDIRKLTIAVFAGVFVVTAYLYLLDVILSAISQALFGSRVGGR